LEFDIYGEKTVSKPSLHMKLTGTLANALNPQDIYNWLVEEGYYPESYVLPPCFRVQKHPSFGKNYWSVKGNGKYSPKIANLVEIQFPKSNLADRTFGIIDPEIHSEIAFEIADNWNLIISQIFNANNLVSSYSFPIPLSTSCPGKIGSLRSGRMIYEFIEMAENDVSSEAYQYNFLVKADIKNFYPSIYTHSLSWAFHGKTLIRNQNNRHNYSYAGNRIDKLFQNSNDGRTNGVAIGPAVSDVVAELLLSRIDTSFSVNLDPQKFLAVRFKDDYRILCKNENDANDITKCLQISLREYSLDISEEKTSISKLPDGLFRPWVSRYHAANPRPKDFYTYKNFKEVYLSVISTDRDLPGTGIVDRFLADIVTEDYKPNFEITNSTITNILSLLMMLARLRIKSFPKILGVIESMMNTTNNVSYANQIGEYLADYLTKLSVREIENRYLIIWILYFLKSNRLGGFIKNPLKFNDPLVKSIQMNRNHFFSSSKDFSLYRGVLTSAKNKNLLQHLDVFSPQ
jgi:hypothetical protein